MEEGGATATKANRRWTAAEFQARLANAPAFRLPRPDDGTVDEQVGGYEHITGEVVCRDPRRPGKCNLLIACYRTHGDDFLPLVERLFSSTGTATNLLGSIRCLDHTDAVRLLGAAIADEIDDLETGVGAAEGWEADLPSTTEGGLVADPSPTHRLDEHPVDPDVGFFSDDELGTRSRSRTAEALSR